MKALKYCEGKTERPSDTTLVIQAACADASTQTPNIWDKTIQAMEPNSDADTNRCCFGRQVTYHAANIRSRTGGGRPRVLPRSRTSLPNSQTVPERPNETYLPQVVGRLHEWHACMSGSLRTRVLGTHEPSRRIGLVTTDARLRAAVHPPIATTRSLLPAR